MTDDSNGSYSTRSSGPQIFDRETSGLMQPPAVTPEPATIVSALTSAPGLLGVATWKASAVAGEAAVRGMTWRIKGR